MLKTFFLFLTLVSCSLATSLAHSQDPMGDSDVIDSIDLGGSPLALTIAGLDANGTGYIIFFVEDETNPQESDTDQLWVVVVNGAGDAVVLNVFEQDNGAFVASSDMSMPLSDWMNAVGLGTMDSCEFNPLCFG